MIDRREFTDYVSGIADKWNMDIEMLEGSYHVIDEDSKNEYQKKIDSLKKQRKHLLEKEGEIEKANDDTLESIKESIQEAKENFEETMKEIKDKFK
jgi:gas vesicle protein